MLSHERFDRVGPACIDAATPGAEQTAQSQEFMEQRLTFREAALNGLIPGISFHTGLKVQRLWTRA